MLILYKMEGSIKRKYEPLDKSLVKKKCKQGTQINTRKCSHLWPRYPCYNKRMMHCESTEGVANLDPIDDILYAVGESYVAITNLMGKLLGAMPENRKLESEEKLIRFFREYGTTLVPLQGKKLDILGNAIDVLPIADGARFVDIDDISNQAREIVPKVAEKSLDVINQMNPGREFIDDVNSRGGGSIYTKIVNPSTGRKVSIYSKKGKEVLQNYFMNM